jgi:hypothetical protein
MVKLVLVLAGYTGKYTYYSFSMRRLPLLINR